MVKNHSNRWLIAVIGVMIIGMIIGVFMIRRENSQYQSLMKSKYDEYNSLEAKFLEASSQIEDETVLVEQADQLLHSVKDAGENVVSILDEYTQKFIEYETAESKTDADVLMNYMLTELVPQLRNYFGNDLVTIGEWYATTDIEQMKSVKWSFVSNYDFAANSNRVMWVCQNDTDLLTFVTAVYHADTGKFDSLRRSMTYEGALLQRGTDSLDGEDKLAQIDSDIQSIMGSLDNIGLTDEQQQQYDEWLNDEDAQKIAQENKQAAEALRDQMAQGGNG